MKKHTTQRELLNRICPICGEGHIKGKKWIFTPNKFLPLIEDGKAVCQKHYKQAYSTWRFETKLKGNEEALKARRIRENKRYSEDPEYRTKILETMKKDRIINRDKIKKRKKAYRKTKEGIEGHRIRSKRHYDKNPEKQRQRMRQIALTPQRQYSLIKRRAKVANIAFELSYEDYLEIKASGKCHYCHNNLSLTAPNIDRLDSARGYIKDNCVPCCIICNTIKRDLLKPEEMIMFYKVLRYEMTIPFKQYSLYTPTTNSTSKKRWGRLKSYATRKNISLELTFEQYLDIIIQPCIYCGIENIGTGYGIDKIIPTLGYTLINSASCCPCCNQIKGNMLTNEEMEILISVIAFYRS